MKSRLLLKAAIVSSCVLGLAGVASPRATPPDATLKLASDAVAAGVGVSWGSGTLTYKGRPHHVSIDGLTVASAGVKQILATGEVYNLKRLADFNGYYTAVIGGAALGGGADGLVMRNQNGVEVRMTGTTRGVDLTAGMSGVRLALK